MSASACVGRAARVAVIIAAACGSAPALAGGTGVTLTFNPGTSTRLYQILGDCDWVEWDATAGGDCVATDSHTTTQADVLGSDLGSSFEHKGRLYFLFGDTIGPTEGPPAGPGPAYYPRWSSFFNNYNFMAHDPIAASTTRRAEDGLTLSYLPNPSDSALPLLVEPKYPAGAKIPRCVGTATVPMGGDDTPNAGISLDNRIYIIVGTNADPAAAYPQLNACSVLVRLDEATNAFTAGREVSQSYYPLPSSLGLTTPPPPGTREGHFVNTALHLYPPPGIGAGAAPPIVLIYGEGQYRGQTSGSSVYLSSIPVSEFWSGKGPDGAPATRYFTGLSRSGLPRWSTDQQDAVPVVYDNPNGVPLPKGPPGFADPGTVGNMSVAYEPALRLWLMTYDGGRAGGPSKNGIWFTYAAAPWGPWAAPQLIFNPCASGGYGSFIFYYFNPSQPSTNNCPAAVSGGANFAGPSGPTIGLQTKNNPATTRGGDYAPFLIARFTEVADKTLTIYYTMSTWNPYTVVLMQSQFAIGR
jgi:hypothetical protein